MNYSSVVHFFLLLQCMSCIDCVHFNTSSLRIDIGNKLNYISVRNMCAYTVINMKNVNVKIKCTYCSSMQK